MHKLTFFPLGNADTTLINLENGHKILIDFANMNNSDDDSDKRIDLESELRKDLYESESNYYDVVAFTHIDTDHIKGSSDFFYLKHADKYQDENRIHIKELWVPAAAILEVGTKDEARIIREEAKHRLKEGDGIRVFSSPGLLDDWLKENGINPEDRKHLITDAGQIIPGYSLYLDGIELFVHSPFASRTENGELLNRNKDALAFQATFYISGQETRVHFLSDIDYEIISDIVNITKGRGRDNRLNWDIIHLPHHCSYNSLGPEKGKYKTEPVPEVKELYEDFSNERGLIISSSDPIPAIDTDQPPHKQAVAYYKECIQNFNGEFKVTMEYPSKENPKPLIITIDSSGFTIKTILPFGVGPITRQRTPRAGKNE